MSEQEGIFRKEALEKLSSPEQLDHLMHVTRARGWLALAAVIGLSIAGALWGLFGRIPIDAAGQGILIKPGGIRQVVALEPGQVMAVTVRPGSRVHRGEAVATIRTGGGAHTDLASLVDGIVLEVLVEPGMLVDRGTPVLHLDPLGSQLQAVIYVPVTAGKRIHRGMPVHLAPASVEAEEYGFMQGTVSFVSEYPASHRGMMALLENEFLVQMLSRGPVLAVEVAPMPDANAPSGFQWSSGRGPAVPITSGTPCTARFILGEQRPFQFLLPQPGA
jgi:HlyD family secretion protein